MFPCDILNNLKQLKMAKNDELSDDIVSDIKRVTAGAFTSWLNENSFTLPKGENLFTSLEQALKGGTIKITNIIQGISELEENSDKKIFLYQLKNYKQLISEQGRILLQIKKAFGYTLSTDGLSRKKPGVGPTFIYLYIDNGTLKMKFSEMHYEREDDFVNEKFIKIPKIVNVFLLIELKTGFTQIRFDSAGQIHTHRNDDGSPSEVIFQNYYKDHFTKIFSEIIFQPFNLNGVANYISRNEKVRFLMRKNVTTVTDGAKQTYSTAKRKTDVRLVKAYVGAAATDQEKAWITEDISGYWLATHSAGELKRDLFMRLYRRDSEIIIQRGCLKKELDYGIKQIREIQKAV